MDELDSLGAKWARTDQVTDVQSSVLPSFEAWLGAAADILYHAQHVKADYSPFLGACVGSTDSLWRFYEALYFETVPEALEELRLDEKTRPLACVRSLAYHSSKEAPLMRRPLGKCSDRRRPISVRAFPSDRYLKARGFVKPRTWISGLAERLRQSAAGHVVTAAKIFYRSAVNRMLADPKYGDLQGDNFAAWLRACHRDIFRDIDMSDPKKVQRKHRVKSIRNPKSKDSEHCLKSIDIPGFEAAFAEIAEGCQWTCKQCSTSNSIAKMQCQNCAALATEESITMASSEASTVRQRMLSKFIVDAFALRSVDLAMILKISNIVSEAPMDKPTVIVLYAGADHTDSVAKFWRSWGFSHSGLCGQGKVAKRKGDGSHCLSLPSYLQDFGKLFPLPSSAKDVALRMARSAEKKAK
jgi:hypothetical protein